MKSKVCLISVISDVYTDQRVLRTANTLLEQNFSVHIIGRKIKGKTNPSKIKYPYQIYHINPLFRKSVLMYACFNILLLFKLFVLVIKNRKKCILLYSNDLDTLLPNFIISKLFQLKLIYDSHELFTEVPELQGKSIKKKIWESIEKMILPKLPFAITVNESIAQWYQKKYHTKFYVIRNISIPIFVDKIKTREELGLPSDKKIIILQGTGINIHRGAEELVQAMQFLDDSYCLLIIGGGDVINILHEMTKDLKISHKIIFKKRMPADELYHYTCNSDLGISIDKPNNLNYLYSLPNKIFSYIQAHIPVLSTKLPEIEKIITHLNIGNFIENHHPEHIAEKIKESVHHKDYQLWKQNTYIAEKELSWEKEKQILKEIISTQFNC